MTYTVSFGWWLVPLALTILFFGIAWCLSRTSEISYYDPIAAKIVDAVIYVAALNFSIIGWLIWAIFV
jgi:hypothetical protein